MKKRFLSLLMALCLMLTLAPAVFATDSADTNWGSDYENVTEFTISSVSDLQAFATMVNEGKDFSEKTVTLTSDLDLSNVTSWVPIGSLDILDSSWNSSDRQPFAGTFDGGNHTISNLKISSGTDDDSVCHDYTGLFGYVTGTVKNVILDNLSITAAYNYLGGIAGYLDSSGEIDNCTVSGTISGASFTNGNEQEAWGSYVGGVVGYSDGTVTDCTSNCQLNDVIEYVGGIVGLCETGTISGCTSNSEISDTLTTTYIGGIVGQLGASGYTKGGSAIDCTNTGDLGAYAYSGGIVGCAYNSTISGCINSGTITGNEWSTNSRENRRIAGIVGDTQGTAISDCTNTGTVNAEALQDVGGIVGLLYYGSTVADCTNSGDITGGKNTGGIVGFAESYSTEGYEVTDCVNSGEVNGGEGVGGIVGVSTANDSVNGSNSKQVISDCVNSGKVSGETDVGGIVGEHNSDVVNTASATSVATVSGCINTGSVSATGESGNAGAIVGNNNDATKSSDTSGATNPGIVQNNFWREELNLTAVGSGAGSSDTETAETVKNNSSYKEDGTLTTPVTDENNNEIKTISDAVDKLLGGTDKAPDILKVTATFNTNGHGTAPSTQEVVIGTKINLPSMDNDGYYTFLYWTANDQTYDAGAEYTVTEDVTFTANWRNDTPSVPTYSVTTPSTENGTVAVSPKYAVGGRMVTITVTPDEGYELDTLTVTDAKGNELALTPLGDSKYSFKMPYSKVTVSATFVETDPEPVLDPVTDCPKDETCPAAKFDDVKLNEWYHDGIHYCIVEGLMNGTSTTTFEPDSATDRAMLVTVLYRLEGQPKAGECPFTDVRADEWYTDAITWAAENEIVEGYGDGTFGPEDPITREQFATILYRYAEYKGYDVSAKADITTFVDGSDTEAWAEDAMAWAVAEKLINGIENNQLDPQGDAIRAQMATILYRFCENVAN